MGRVASREPLSRLLEQAAAELARGVSCEAAAQCASGDEPLAALGSGRPVVHACPGTVTADPAGLGPASQPTGGSEHLVRRRIHVPNGKSALAWTTAR
jgi:hypothetical protein